MELDLGGEKMLSILALHENTHLTDDCVELLNDKWPRSKAARLHSITKACSTLPYSLVLVEDESTVVGYCRLAKVISNANSVLVESVVVDKKRRGQGLGRHVMEMAEQHAARAGFHRMYLCTKDKQGFYQHLGYSFCKSVNTLGAMMLETCDCSPETNTPLPLKDQGADCQSCGSTAQPAISPETNTPLPLKDGGADCQSCGSTLQPGISPSDTIPTETSDSCNGSNKTVCCSAPVCKSAEVKRKDPPPPEPPQGVVPPPPPPPPTLPSSARSALRIDWMVKDIVHLS